MLAPLTSIKKAYNEFHENPTNGSDTDTWSQTGRWMRSAHVASTQGTPFLLHKECLKSNNLTATYIS
jgi:hypothetical protein